MLDSKTAGRMISYFSGLLDFYEKFLALEQDKHSDLAEGKLNLLDGCMKKEEVFVLKARGLEQERMKLMEQISMPKARFRDIIPLFPADCRGQIQTLYEKLSSVLLKLRETNGENQAITERKLRRASAVIAKAKGHPELEKIYGKSTGSPNQGPVFLSKKI